MENISAIIEALILASENPLGLDKICSILEGTDRALIRDALDNLIAGYEQREGGVTIGEVAGGYQFRTRPEVSDWVKKLKSTRPPTLSAAALETLAIVAYRQPIIKSEIEGVRGVDSGAALKSLLQKKLVRIVGRKDVPGRPIIYGTTRKFLEVFNLRELTDLPSMRELKEITEQQGVLDLEGLQTEMTAHRHELQEIFKEDGTHAGATENDGHTTDENPGETASSGAAPDVSSESETYEDERGDTDIKIIQAASEDISDTPIQDKEPSQKLPEGEPHGNEITPEEFSEDDTDV